MADKLTTPLSVPELASSPSNPSSGYQKIYAKSDGKLYVRTSAGTETELTNAAGSGNIYTTDGTISGTRSVSLDTNAFLEFVFSDAEFAISIDDANKTLGLYSKNGTVSSAPGGNLTIKAGDGLGAIGGNGGNIDISSGYGVPATSSSGGDIIITAQDGGSASGGSLYLNTGFGGNGGGGIVITTGSSSGGDGGDIEINFGAGNTNNGRLYFPNYAYINKGFLRLNSGYAEPISSKILTLDFGVSSGDIITTGAKGRKACTVSGTIKGWKLITDTPSTITVDVWKANNAIPTNSNSITASAKPSITGGQYASSTTLTGWTTAVSDNDVFVFEVESNDNAKYILLILEIEI